MAWKLAGDPKVAARFHETSAKNLLPEPVHRHASGERMVLQKQPLGEPKPILRQRLRKWRQHVGRLWLDLVLPLVVFAAFENVGLRHLGPLVHHMGDRASLLDLRHLRLERAHGGRQRLVLLVRQQPALVEIARRRNPLVGRQRHDGSESVRPPACRHLLSRQRAAPDREIREADALQIATFRAAAHRERHRRLDRLVAELVPVDFRLLWLAVIGDRHAFGLPGAIVGDRDERPGIGRKLGFGHDLDGLLGPGVNQVHRDPAVVHPHVPATVLLRLVHAGNHGAARATTRWPQPEGDTERIMAFEVAAAREFGCPAVQHDRGRSARPRLPRRGLGERQIGLLAEEGNVGR